MAGRAEGESLLASIRFAVAFVTPLARARTNSRSATIWILCRVDRVQVAFAANLNVKAAARVAVRTTVGGEIEPAITVSVELARRTQIDNRRARIIANSPGQSTFAGPRQWRTRIS